MQFCEAGLIFLVQLLTYLWRCQYWIDPANRKQRYPAMMHQLSQPSTLIKSYLSVKWLNILVFTALLKQRDGKKRKLVQQFQGWFSTFSCSLRCCRELEGTVRLLETCFQGRNKTFYHRSFCFLCLFFILSNFAHPI